MTHGWPADPDAISRAREFLASVSGGVIVASHNDVDGLCAAMLMLRGLKALGVSAQPLPARRGEHVHQDVMRARMRALAPEALIVVDTGTRPGAILDSVPTLVVDHHDAAGGVPSGALLVNGYDREPVAPSSVLAYVICRDFPGVRSLAWLAALGAVADLGTAAPFAQLLDLDARGTAWSRAAALLNAARRAPQDDALTALQVLDQARSVQDIAAGKVPGAERLEEYRLAVVAEVDRCSRIPPEVMGDAALIRFSSGAQIHPLIATRWSRRLAPRVVIAANDGFIPGRVNFAMRCAADINLLQWLRSLPFTPSPGDEYANGHPRATGGSLPVTAFDAFLQALRQRPEALRKAAPAPRQQPVRRPVGGRPPAARTSRPARAGQPRGARPKGGT